jgi:(p)ppGpp synthase/HD superfamily hydrolase
MIKNENQTATIEDAILIAAEAHKGVTDKAGNAYIFHPIRMMMRLKSEAEMMTAVLHDVVEDTRENSEETKWTIEKLRDKGFPEEVLEAVESVTNRHGESYEEFIERAGKNPIARRVKIVDLEDNMNLLRLGELKPEDLARLEKYHRSWRLLTAEKSNFEI